jgi:dodecin
LIGDQHHVKALSHLGLPRSPRRRSGEGCEGRGPVYRIIQVAGSSEKSIEDAIHNAVSRASSTLRQVGWFEVVETRGHVEDGRVAHYQVTLKVGFTLDDD